MAAYQRNLKITARLIVNPYDIVQLYLHLLFIVRAAVMAHCPAARLKICAHRRAVVGG